ncbi:TetR/AcrR family transcriptional regulator [Thermocatellispora tengchongensis]|uniref:TetR/AcrR family transcriptional regulator n=1 Tax=Thermocatellispora tengchongensis TaxID=1073253 RepID=UPI00362FCA90
MAPPAGPANAVGERDLRAERILDAAGELLIAWGYRRVTIEDVARRAGIGKGTVYLHFSTKEVLFITVLMRAQARMMGVILDEMRADPAAVLPSRMATAGYLRVREEPLLRALLTGDMETLGTLARTAPAGVAEVYEMRLRTLREYFALLRRHGLVRADQPAEAQVQAYMSVLLGFLTAEPFLPPGAGGARSGRRCWRTSSGRRSRPKPPPNACAPPPPR